MLDRLDAPAYAQRSKAADGSMPQDLAHEKSARWGWLGLAPAASGELGLANAAGGSVGWAFFFEEFFQRTKPQKSDFHKHTGIFGGAELHV